MCVCVRAGTKKSRIENTRINKAKARGETLSVSAFGSGLKDVLTQKNSRCGQAIIFLTVCPAKCVSRRLALS